MKIIKVVLRQLEMRMEAPFYTSYGMEWDKHVIIVEVTTATGAVGYAECVAMENPFYTEENVDTAWIILCKYLVPRLENLHVHTVNELHSLLDLFSFVKGHRMAKAALEMAVWDAYAAETEQPLVLLLGGTRSEIPVGISVGIDENARTLVEKVKGYIDQGYHRVKIKIKPGYDYEPLFALRQAFPHLQLMADANSAYTLSDTETLQRLDPLKLTMIEQPLAYDDLIDHATLQSQIQTPICLDESIRSAEDARKAIAMGACQVINLKLGRVGGFAEALRIHQLCVERSVGLWCGGMLETGIGRLHNIALTALLGFTMPGDTAPSARYFAQDLIAPPVEFSHSGYLAVEALAGVAGRVIHQKLEQATVRQQVFFQQM